MRRITANLVRELSVAQVEELVLSQSKIDNRACRVLESDARVGIRRIAARIREDLRRRQAERARVDRMREFENRLWNSGISVVAGVDEVGRGCLAGPVVAAAVVFEPDIELFEIDDSKQLAPKVREGLCEQIFAQALTSAIAFVDVADIDRFNILQGSLLAMRRALSQLTPAPERVLVDGSMKSGSGFVEMAIVNGDERSVSIAAASIIAKVHRDRLMQKLDALYPQYGFASNKGYATVHHRKALAEHGPCALHRRSFEPVAAHFRPAATKGLP